MFEPNGNIDKNAKLLLHMRDKFMPYVYTGAGDELKACRETAWLGSFLNLSPVYDISGPDAVELLNKVCVNRDFAGLKIGGSRHAILCNDKGQMLADGVLIRKGEDQYRTYWLAPALAYYVDTMGMDVQGKWVMDEFFFQIDGPKSLEIMEQAAKTDLHHLKFAQNDQIQIDGIDVTIHRLGMSGCLAYEMHGDTKDGEQVFGAIMEAGKPFGIKPLGFGSYCRNHTQAGYPNQWIHYTYPLNTSGEGLKNYVQASPFAMFGGRSYQSLGSASDDQENAFVTPFDVDWDYLINYDHDFIGKEALSRLKENPPRKVVTLEWNAEDVGKVFASQFEGEDVKPADEITTPGDGGEAPFVMSKVVSAGKQIGVATGRIRDYYHKKMLSLAYLDRDFADLGNEVTVIWGTDPEAQMEIRATVAQYPYYNEEYRNETFDVEKIPHPVFD